MTDLQDALASAPPHVRDAAAAVRGWGATFHLMDSLFGDDDTRAGDELKLMTEDEFIGHIKKGASRRTKWNVDGFELRHERKTGVEGLFVAVRETVRFSNVLSLTRRRPVFVPLHDPDAAHLMNDRMEWWVTTGADFDGFAYEGEEDAVESDRDGLAMGTFSTADEVMEVIRRLAPDILQGRAFRFTPNELQRLGRKVVRASPYYIDPATIPQAVAPAPARKRL
jgi:hypothetical protein